MNRNIRKVSRLLERVYELCRGGFFEYAFKIGCKLLLKLQPNNTQRRGCTRRLFRTL